MYSCFWLPASKLTSVWVSHGDGSDGGDRDDDSGSDDGDVNDDNDEK